MAVHDHRATSPSSVNFAVITVSDTRTTASDSSGDKIQEMLRSRSHEVVMRTIVHDEPAEILAALKKSVEGRAEAVIFTGGTGLTSRDVTRETVLPLMDRQIDGFGELFRYISFQEIGSAALMSRSFAGIIGRKPVFCLPGSTEAVRLAMEKLVLPEIGHILREVRR